MKYIALLLVAYLVAFAVIAHIWLDFDKTTLLPDYQAYQIKQIMQDRP